MADILFSRDGAVLTITLNRPEKLNALSHTMLTGLRDAVSGAASDGQTRAIILAGEGRSFCAGADLKAVGSMDDDAGIRSHAFAMHDALCAIRNSVVPVISAVHGFALGAGCGFVAVSHMAVADAAAQFGYPELTHGIMPALVAPGLVDRVGPHRALALLTTGRQFGADEALSLGIVTEVTPSNPVLRAQSIAQALADASTSHVRDAKALVELCASRGFDEGMALAVKLNIEARLAKRAKNQA